VRNSQDEAWSCVLAPHMLTGEWCRVVY